MKHARLLSAGAALLAAAMFTTVHAAMPETPPDVAAAPADAVKTASGIASKVLTKGTGTDHPGPTDKVKVHYSGWTTDGKMFDSSVERGEPIEFPLNQVIKGWTEGVQLMVTGEKRRLWIPANLAYGENPPGGAPKGMLVFDIELLSFTPGPKPPTPPADVKAAPADAVKSESGLVSKVTKKGTGTANPKDADTVKVHIALWSPNGDLLNSTSADGGEPQDIPLDQLRLGGLAEGLKLMVAGEKRTLWISAELAFGKNPPPGAPTEGVVVEAELLGIKEGVAPPPVPADVAAAPADADKTASGLASKVISKGTGTAHPKTTDTVTVHYSGWTTDGKMFDSSVKRGTPATFPLTGVIKGWTEGVPLMVVGEKRRFWIPSDLAYGPDAAQMGRPAGMLVFDIELIKIGE